VCAPSASGNVKLAVYDADNVTGAPLHRLGYTTAPVGSGTNGSVLHDIAFPETAVEAGNSYWLAAISDTQVIGYKLLTPATWESKTVATLYSEFDFPEDLTGYSLPDESTKQYLLAGNALPFVFVMSIEGTSLMQPNGDLYGAIAGDAEVYIKPGCTLELTDVPEAGLDFPGEDSGSDEDAGSPLTVRTYTIE